MEVVLALAIPAIYILVACINLLTAILNIKREKKKDLRSAKRGSE